MAPGSAGKTALVTGATSGIGRAAALALAGAGWWVLGTGRDEPQAEQLAKELADAGRGTAAAADLRDPDAPDRLIEVVRRERGALHALVNNAGIHFLATTEQTDMAVYDELMTVNLRAAYALSRAAIGLLRDSGGGVIVNVASEAGLVAVPGQAAYNVSKAALIMLTKSLAADHAEDGIRAVSVCPGTTRTPLVDEAIASAADPQAHERKLASTRPANRLGRVEEIAAAIVFAASDDVAFLTGSEIVVDGGYTAV